MRIDTALIIASIIIVIQFYIILNMCGWLRYYNKLIKRLLNINGKDYCGAGKLTEDGETND